MQRLRGEMFNKMMHLPTSYFSSNTGGRLMSRILNDVNQITDAGFNVITVIAKDGVSVVGLLGLLTYLNWRLTLITFYHLAGCCCMYPNSQQTPAQTVCQQPNLSWPADAGLGRKH